MFITSMALPRRTFLRGLGATRGAAVPGRDGSGALRRGGQKRPRPVSRLGFVYVPMGSAEAYWTPKSVGRITELSPTLSSLTPFLDQVTVISNLEHKNAYATGNHATANCTYLSGVRAKLTDGSDYQMGTTADQIAAKQMGRQTPLPSLELATDFNYVVGNCDNGYACVYMNTLSWSTPTTPLPTEANPRVVFERMFGDGGTLADRRADLRKSGSILDWVTGDMARLKQKLGPGDRTKVSEYLDSVREIERRIQLAEKQNGAALPAELDRPIGAPQVWEDHVKLMFDLQVLALQADITRVISFQLAREVSTRTYPQIGVPEAHHPDVASPERSGEAREAGEDQRLSRVAVRVFPRQAEGHARRRRVAARSHAVPVWQRHGQSGCARSHQAADPGGGRRVRQAEGRPSHQLREADADVEPAVDDARQGRHRNDQLRRQLRQGRRAARAAVSVTRPQREGVMVMGPKRLGGSLVVLVSLAGAVAHAQTPLLDAVKKGDKAAIRGVLAKHVDVNAAEPDGTTALHLAVQANDLAAADLLIQAGANVKAVNRYGVTPLSLACVNGSGAMIQRLLSAGADVNATLPGRRDTLDDGGPHGHSGRGDRAARSRRRRQREGDHARPDRAHVGGRRGPHGGHQGARGSRRGPEGPGEPRMDGLAVRGSRRTDRYGARHARAGRGRE